MSAGRCVILGAGGHGRVILDCLRASGIEVEGFLDAERPLWGQDVDGIPVLGGDERLAEMKAAGVSRFAVGVGGVKDLAPRKRLYEAGLRAGLEPLTVRHPSAVVSAAAELGPGAQILPGAVVNTGARVGAGALINSTALVEHDVTVGDHAHVSIGARLAGGVRVGALAFVGAGALVREGVEIGDGALIGCGAIVLARVAPGARVVGLHRR